MPSFDIPFLGNLLLCSVLVCSAYTFSMCMGAAGKRPHMLLAARYGTYATCALVLAAVCVLAYAFQTHDFRIRYVARYSDRSMHWTYLLTSLWGGQDGSMLWWVFLVCCYTAAVNRWMRGRYLEFQPWVLATLMSIVAFFIATMLFAANPFATYVSAAPPDGEGLNPLLQNYWMTIHPPSLYLGFVGWSVPFAFVVAALATGRLSSEWVLAVRRWAMLAWTFLSIGLTLGMIWSYEELGWGGYWAWDPVENASFMPWLVGTAYLHSAIIQERYGMLKVWNVFLLLLTYFMTIFGTFLTRSGLISSVHSFARSDIGNYFVGYMIALAVGCAALLIWRLPKLKAEHKLQSLLSREFAFLFNNWILLFMMLVVLVLTTYPLATEFFEGEPATVGPAAYNAIMVPIGLILLCLMGVGPMVAWRKATGKNLRRALRYPIATAGAVGAGHLMFGDSLGFPALVDSVAPYDTFAGEVFAAITEICPVASTTLCAFVLGTIFQEFARGTLVRMRKGETWFLAFVTLMSRARRRYGGYIVHVGIALMYFGFTGAAYDVETEGALMPGESLSIEGYRVRYDQSRREVDRNKMAIYADLTIFNESSDKLGTAAPAKFIYHTHREMPTTEVSIRVGARDDLYLIMSTIDPASKRGTFRAIVRPLVVWIWVGFAFLLLGAAISLMPTARELLKGSITPGTRGARSRRRPFDGALDPGGVRAGGAARTVSAPASGSPAEKWSRPSTPMIALLLVSPIGMGPVASAQSSSSSSLHAGSVVIEGDQERILFQRTLCQCGDCARLPMDSCGCSWAENKRAEMRQRLKQGETVPQIMEEYRAQYGRGSIAIPPDSGSGRLMWALPLAIGTFAAVGLCFVGRLWRSRSLEQYRSDGPALEDSTHSDYEAKLEEELRRLEGD